MEGTHRQLRTRLANTLGRNDSHGHAFFHLSTGRQVHAITLATYAKRGIAGHRTAYLNLLETQFLNFASYIGREHLVFGDDDLVGNRINDVRSTDATLDRFF